ncbi:MAG: ATP-dependent sacrificial sulfur transferase LarE [Blastocatellia bacterium]|nr:ATP-dependent sacrificial sulfur transferase LarE [Blastocatellia bacterium]
MKTASGPDLLSQARAVRVGTAEEKERQLRAWLQDHAPVLIAFSGGVDSAYLAVVAHQELGDRALSVTAVSPSLAAEQREDVTHLVQDWGLRHEWISTNEMDRVEYRSNPSNRCYFCKDELFTELTALATRRSLKTLCDGNNADDLADYRPGMQAARNHGVQSPLVVAGFTKNEIRERSRFWQLPTAEKPASPCLSSRIPYGMPVTLQKLSVIERGERALRTLGFRVVRLRHHDNLARVEIGSEELHLALDPSMAQRMLAALKPLGFAYVTLDLEGFRSGALNVGLHKQTGATGQ